MTNWSAFAGLTGVVLVLLLALARLSQDSIDESTNEADSFSTESESESEHKSPVTDNDEIEAQDGIEGMPGSTSQPHISTDILLVNVALSQGLFAVILAASAWYTGIPPTALGVDFGNPSSVGLPALATGIVVGLVLYAFNAAGGASATALGYEYEERLREFLTPETSLGWLLLLCGVLPIIAVFEELLFRAALIGALSTGFDISPWFLAGGSSVAFAFGHGAQGRLGILVTGILGFALAVVFIHTNSLLAVVVAHYLVNALEFVISGGLGIEWG